MLRMMKCKRLSIDDLSRHVPMEISEKWDRSYANYTSENMTTNI